MKHVARLLALAGLLLAGACSVSSPIMDTGDGVYYISVRAPPILGGATGAQTVAHEDAQKFCAQKGDGLHPVVVSTQERDIYQSSYGGQIFGTPNGSLFGGFQGGTSASGVVNMRFRCAQ